MKTADTDILNRRDTLSKMRTGVTGEMLRELREYMGLNLSQFGLALKRSLESNAKKGYTRQYIDRLERGKDAITPRLAYAYYSISSALDSVPAGYGGTVTATV